jgi:TIR domain/SIR2-like domain
MLSRALDLVAMERNRGQPDGAATGAGLAARSRSDRLEFRLLTQATNNALDRLGAGFWAENRLPAGGALLGNEVCGQPRLLRKPVPRLRLPGYPGSHHWRLPSGSGRMGVDDDFWGDLLGYIRQQMLVTVTGPDLSVVDGTDQTLTALIGQKLAENYDLDVSPRATTMGESVAAFLRQPGRRDTVNRLYRVIFEIIEDLDPKPGEPLKNLAAISDIRLFMNTTPDHLLLQALNEVGSRGTSAIREITFCPNGDTKGQLQNERPAADTDTVVLNLFGRATRLPQYVIHEEDRLEWLHTLLSDAATFPRWLDDRLRSQPMLFVGCEIPDWIGRFLLRRTANDRLSGGDLKQFFFVNSSVSQEPALSSFFKTYTRETKVQQLETEMAPTDFVAELRERWEKLSPARRAPAPGRPAPPAPPAPDAPTIFISYMREDADAARRLHDAITGLGGVAWWDERRLLPGDWWHEEILTAIHSKTVRLFIAVVSANTEQEDEGYVFSEWKEATARSRQIISRRFIVPVAIDEHYDPNSYEKILKAFPDFKKMDFGHAPCGDPDDTLLAMLTGEIRAMRRTGAQ